MDILHEIAEVIGVESAVKLGQTMGGARVYVPEKAGDEHPLALVLGQEAAQRLCDHFKGDTVDLPSKFLFRKVRDQVIRKEYLSLKLPRACKADHLAVRYGLSRRQILNIARKES